MHEWRHTLLDWDDLRFYLALARHGGLSAAANELHVAQSTVGRRLASIEASLGVRLLNRTPDGYVMTRAGEDVLTRAERLESEAVALERLVGGQDARLAGLVRVTSVEAVSSYILAPCFASLIKLHPNIMIELVPDPRELSLSMREADISVRLTRPTQHDLVIRRIGTVSFGLYASPAYLEQHRSLDFADGCSGHYLIAQHNDIQGEAQMEWLLDLAPRARIALHTGSHEAAVSAAVHGCGLACLARFRGDYRSGLTQVAIPTSVPSSEVWLVVHKDNRKVARIRAALNHIAEHMKNLSQDLVPSPVGWNGSAESVGGEVEVGQSGVPS
jgi:DNA-binding transcriptional LysR family regulator